MSSHHYDVTARGVMEWAKSELEHVGRIASVKDADLQYSYAMSTVYGMAHLKDALKQLVDDDDYKHKRADLLKLHDAVIRVMKKLVGDYEINLDAIRAFNERNVLSNLGYLEEEKGSHSRSSHSAKKSSKKNWKNSTNIYSAWMKKKSGENEEEEEEEESSSDEEEENTMNMSGGRRRRKTHRRHRKAHRRTRRR
jgi:hypothetical protein